MLLLLSFFLSIVHRKVLTKKCDNFKPQDQECGGESLGAILV